MFSFRKYDVFSLRFLVMVTILEVSSTLLNRKLLVTSEILVPLLHHGLIFLAVSLLQFAGFTVRKAFNFFSPTVIFIYSANNK